MSSARIQRTTSARFWPFTNERTNEYFDADIENTAVKKTLLNKMMNKRLTILLVSCIGFFLAPATFAESGGAAFAEGVNYLPIKPSLVVNYGGPGKVKYIKAEISMRVEDAHAAQEVTHHMPLVRDTLIMLLSSMTDEQVSSGEGKEQMRQQALAKVNEALAAQIGHAAEEKDEKTAKKESAQKDDHGKKEKTKKDEKSKDAKAKSEHSDEHKKAEHKPAQLVTDLLFDNLVVQR